PPWGHPPRDFFFHHRPLTHSMSGAGVVHHIIRVGLVAYRRLSLYPYKQTSLPWSACLKCANGRHDGKELTSPLQPMGSGPLELSGTYRLISTSRRILDTGAEVSAFGKNAKGAITNGNV